MAGSKHGSKNWGPSGSAGQSRWTVRVEAESGSVWKDMREPCAMVSHCGFSSVVISHGGRNSAPELRFGGHRSETTRSVSLEPHQIRSWIRQLQHRRKLRSTRSPGWLRQPPHHSKRTSRRRRGRRSKLGVGMPIAVPIQSDTAAFAPSDSGAFICSRAGCVGAFVDEPDAGSTRAVACSALASRTTASTTPRRSVTDRMPVSCSISLTIALISSHSRPVSRRA